MTDTTDTDEIPGDYDTFDGMKERALALGNPIIPKYLDRAKDRLVERDGGYSIEAPDVDPNNAEMLFHFGILAGAALEREYPAPGENDDLRELVEEWRNAPHQPASVCADELEAVLDG